MHSLQEYLVAYAALCNVTVEQANTIYETLIMLHKVPESEMSKHVLNPKLAHEFLTKYQ